MSNLEQLIEQFAEAAAVEYVGDQVGGHRYADTLKAVLTPLLPAVKQVHDEASAPDAPTYHINIGVPGQAPISSQPITLPAQDLTHTNPMYDK